MNDYLMLYGFTLLDKFVGAFTGLTFGFLVLGFICLANGLDRPYSVSMEDDAPRRKRWFAKSKLWFCIAVFFGCSFIAMPSQKDMALIVGGKMAIDIAHSKPVSDISAKLIQLINKKLDEAAK